MGLYLCFAGILLLVLLRIAVGIEDIIKGPMPPETHHDSDNFD